MPALHIPQPAFVVVKQDIRFDDPNFNICQNIDKRVSQSHPSLTRPSLCASGEGCPVTLASLLEILVLLLVTKDAKIDDVT